MSIIFKKYTRKTSNKRRVIVKVKIDQRPVNDFTITQLDFKVWVKKRIAWLWWNTTAVSGTISGQYTSNRAPTDQTGDPILSPANPFFMSPPPSSGLVTHFIDFSAASLDAFSVATGTYSATMLFDNGETIQTEVSW